MERATGIEEASDSENGSVRGLARTMPFSDTVKFSCDIIHS